MTYVLATNDDLPRPVRNGGDTVYSAGQHAVHVDPQDSIVEITRRNPADGRNVFLMRLPNEDIRDLALALLAVYWERS